MLFSIDTDIGEQIVGWIMPDNPNATPRVAVRVGSDTHLIDATVYRPLLKEQGLHNHGVCGLVIDQQNCPGLSRATDLSVFDAASGILVYRRRLDRKVIPQKFLRIETHLLADRFLDQILAPRFQMAYARFEAVPEETKMSILRVGYSQSLYVTGRILPRAIDALARSQGFRLGIVLRDPFEELAERLILMAWCAEKERSEVIAALGAAAVDAAKSLSAVDLSSVQGLKKGLPLLDREAVARFLSNPLARQLSSLAPGDELDSDAVAMSLDYLGAVDAVGLRSDTPATLEVFAAALDADEPFPATFPGVSPYAKSLGDRLREVAFCGELIGEDIQIHKTAEQVLRRARARDSPV